MSSLSRDPEKIERFLNRAVESIYPSREALRERLRQGERLRVYLGIDPTGELHIGHLITIRKLAELQALGHEVILLVGDFTAMIGDPTGKFATRKRLTAEQVRENCRNYEQQISRFLPMNGENPGCYHYNSAWFQAMTFTQVIEIAAHFTVQQMVERDMFERRIAEGKPVFLHEFFYPLMQGYDSVALNVDLEVCGNDQTFNALAGRALVKEMLGKEKFVLTAKLLTDTSGKKMGKTEGNMVNLSDQPEDMYGKVMSWTDRMILPGFELCTDVSDQELNELKERLQNGENPMVLKRQLAAAIVTLVHGPEAAETAAAAFQRVHSEGGLPEQITELQLDTQQISLLEALVRGRLVASRSEAQRQVEQGAVKVNDEVVSDWKYQVILSSEGVVIQKGKRHFLKLVFKEKV